MRCRQVILISMIGMARTAVELLVATVAWMVLSRGPIAVLSKPAESNNNTVVSCWAQINEATETCGLLVKVNITMEECCKLNSERISWSPVLDVSGGDLIWYTTMYGGVPYCKLCEKTCEQIRCPPDRKCMMKNDRPRCVCKPDCAHDSTLHRGPVCATNGKDYRSMCAFLKMKCRQQDEYFELDVSYNGPCQNSCDSVQCLGNKCCEEDQHGRPHCVSYNAISCPAPFNEEFVCGEDGVSYESLCQLRRTSCSSGRIIPVEYNGKCENLTSCNDTSCVSRKECMWDQVANTSRCILCNFMCTGWAENVLVCGTDGRTYDNWCDMQEHICDTGTYVEKVHFGNCNIESSITEPGSGHWTPSHIDFTPPSWQVLQDLQSNIHRGQGKDEDESIALNATTIPASTANVTVNSTADSMVNSTADSLADTTDDSLADSTATTPAVPVLDTPSQLKRDLE